MGVTLMIVIVILLSSVMAGMVLTFGGGLEEPEFLNNTTDSSVPLNPWDSKDELLSPKNPVAGAEDVRYRVVFDIQENTGGDSNDAVGNSLNGVRIIVDNVDRSMFSGVSKPDVETFEVQRENGTTTEFKSDVQDEDNWEFDNDNNELKMTLTGNYDIKAGDEITIIIADVDNPSDPGTYDVTVQLNNGEDQESGKLEIIEE